MSQTPPDWAWQTPSVQGVHTEPASFYQWQNLTQQQVNALRTLLLESIYQALIQLFTGVLLPGPAGTQIAGWAEKLLPNDVLTELVTGITTGNPNLVLQAFFTDLKGLLGNPLGLGTGSLTPQAILADVPLLGGLFQAGTSLVAETPLRPFLDAVSQGFGGTTGLTFPGLQTFLSGLGLSGLGGGTGIVQQLIDGAYQAVHGGTSTGNLVGTFKTSLLNIPGGNIISAVLPSIVPGLDATKITTGLLGQARIPSLSAGGGYTGAIDGGVLSGAASIASSLLAALDASKITTGLFGQARIPSLSSAGGYTGAVDGGVLSGAINTATTIGGTALSTLFTSGKFNPAQIASGAIASGVTLGSTALTGLATGVQTWLGAGGALPSATTLASTGLTGLATGIGSWLGAGGALPGATTLGASGLTGLAAGVSTWLTAGGALPTATSATASQIISGVFGTGLIPGLDASKIISGTFANSFSPGLLPQTLWQATTVAAKNLVISPQFSDSTITREAALGVGASLVYSTTTARSGTQCMKLTTITATSGNNDHWFLSPHTLGGAAAQTPASYIKVQPGQWIYSEIYVKADAANTATNGTLRIGAYLMDSTGTNAITFPTMTNIVNMSGLSSSAWTKISGWYQIPAGYDLIAPIFWSAGTTAANQVFYIDDARIAEESVAQSIIQQLFGGSTISAALNTALTIIGNPLSSLFNSSGLISSFISGVLGTGLIPGLDASKIISGTFANSFSPGLLPQTIFQAARTGAKNLIYNPDFQDSTAPLDFLGAATSSGTYSTTFAHSGTQSFKFVTGNGTAGGSSDALGLGVNNANTGAGSMWAAVPGAWAASIKVQPGQWLYTEFYARAETTNTATAGGISISAFVDDSTGVNASVVPPLTNILAPNAISSSGWTKLSGWYQIPAGLDRVRPFIWINNQNVINQTFYFDDAMIREETHANSILNTLATAWGGAGSNYLLADLTTFAQTIPYQSVLGNLGASQIGNTVANFVDTAVNAVQNNAVTGNSFSVLNSALSAMRGMLGYTTSGAPAATSVAGIGNFNNTWVNNTAVTKPIWANLDPTMDSTFQVSDVKDRSPLPTIGFSTNAAAASVVGFIPITHGGVKQSIAWLGYPTGGSMAGATFFLSVHKLNTGTGALSQVYASADISGSVATGSTPVWNYLNLPSASYITCNQGDVYAVIATCFNVTYNFLGVTATVPPSIVSGQFPARSAGVYTGYTPTFDSISTGPGTLGWGTLTEPILIGGNANCVVVPVAIRYTTASPPTTFTVDINGTNLPQIGSSLQFSTSGGLEWRIFWFGATFAPGAFGGSANVHVVVSGGTSGIFDARAFTYNGVSGISSFGQATGTSATIALSNSLNGGATQVIAASTQFAANISNTNFNTRWNLASGVNYPMVVGDVLAVNSATPAWSFGSGNASAKWGISGLYLSGMYIPQAAPPYNATIGSNLAYSTATPFMGLSGAAGVTKYSPLLVPIYGSQTVTNYATQYPWANWFDLIVCGAGPGGDHGGTLQGSQGGTDPGHWNGVTLSRAQMGTSNITWTIGSGGAGGASTSAGGGTGGNSSVNVPSWGTLTGNGGTGHGSAVVADRPGASNAGYNFADHYGNVNPYPGGAGGATAQAVGQQPGGCGAGGNANSYGSNINGGNGGAGIGWALVYQ